MIRVWNMLFYFLYRWEILAARVFNYPFIQFFKSQKVKKHLHKKGVNDPDLIFERAMNNKETGFNSFLASRQMDVLLLALVLGILNSLSIVIEKLDFLAFFLNNFILSALLIGIVVFGFNYLALYKTNRYLSYFREFSETSKKVRLRNSWLTFITVVFIYVFCLASFLFYGKVDV